MSTKNPIIDFHSHILPKMDDGSKGSKMSCDMLSHMDGTDIVCATSHFYGHREDVSRFLSRREASWQRLLQSFDENVHPTIILGAEVAYIPSLIHLPKEELGKLCYSGTNTILLEMPFSSWSRAEVEALSVLTLDMNFHILLAHFERFVSLQRDAEIWDVIFDLPIDLQMNAETIIPFFGRKKWLKWFEKGRTIVLGSDCHNLDKRPPNLSKGRAILSKALGNDVLDEIDVRGAKILSLTSQV